MAKESFSVEFDVFSIKKRSILMFSAIIFEGQLNSNQSLTSIWHQCACTFFVDVMSDMSKDMFPQATGSQNFVCVFYKLCCVVLQLVNWLCAPPLTPVSTGNVQEFSQLL